VRIVVDARERGSGVPLLLQRHGLNVELKRLKVGDYAVGAGAVVERKTIRGLQLDVIEGRFWRQLGRLRHGARLPYLLLEGGALDRGPLGANAIRGALLAAADLGIAVIRSVDPIDSALWLRLLAERRQVGTARYRPAYAQRPKAPVGVGAAEAALSAIPKVSSVTARALLAEFGSLAAVVAADPREWQRVPGVGPQRARALLTTIRVPGTTSRS
jgi:ERCC4-type nuclease